MRIELDLSRHCIETAIRRRYNRCLSLAFKAGMPDCALEEEIDLLKTVLESFDFSHLRSNWPQLAGRRKAGVAVERDRLRQIRILIDGLPLPIAPE